MNSKDRICMYLSQKGMGRTVFEEKIGMSRGSLSKRQSGFNSDSLEKISAYFPDLNMNWLLTGLGESTFSYENLEEKEYSKKYFELLEDSNKVYKENGELRRKVSDLEVANKQLRDKLNLLGE